MGQKRGAPTVHRNGLRHLHFSGDRELYESFEKVVFREGDTLSHNIQKYMQEYVKVHGEGNPCYEITKWSEDPEFKALPALLAKNEEWEKFIPQCSINELAQIQGSAKFIEQIADKAWTEKKFPVIKKQSFNEQMKGLL